MKNTRLAEIKGTSYRVSELGEIINKYCRPLRGSLSNGYRRHFIRVQGKTVILNTARTVYEAFNGPIQPGYEIDHVDGNKLNNTPSNLIAKTHKENMNNPITKKKLMGPRNQYAIKYERIY